MSLKDEIDLKVSKDILVIIALFKGYQMRVVILWYIPRLILLLLGKILSIILALETRSEVGRGLSKRAPFYALKKRMSLDLFGPIFAKSAALILKELLNEILCLWTQRDV